MKATPTTPNATPIVAYGHAAPPVSSGTMRPAPNATAKEVSPVRHQARYVRSVASRVRRVASRTSSTASASVCLDEHLCDLGSRELRRWQLALREQLAHLRAREEDVVVAPVRAGLRRRHLAADLAEERVLEEHRLDVELVRLELVEDQLRVVGAVVVADAGVVAADDEVRAAVVLAADRVPDRLARAGVAHRRREGGDEHAVGGVVAVHEDAVALDPGRGRDVVRLRVADERVDQEAVDGLERDLGQVLVGAVDRVARLEADDALPAALCEVHPRFG